MVQGMIDLDDGATKYFHNSQKRQLAFERQLKSLMVVSSQS